MRPAFFIAASILFATPLAGQTISLPAKVVTDAPTVFRAAGLPPGRTVTIEVERVTAAGLAAASSNDYAVAGDGTVDPARDAPLRGYDGVDRAGPFWSMQPLRVTASGVGAEVVRVRVREAGVVLAEAQAPLIDLPAGVAFADVEAFPGARLYRPDDGRARPLIIVIGGSEGGSSFGRSLAPHLAARGYAVLALPYYNAAWGDAPIAGLPTAFTDIPVDRLEAVHRWATHRPDVDADAMALYGVSKGGEFAMVAATRFRWLRAVIGIVPSDVVWEGWGAGPINGTRSSFSWRSRPLAFTPYKGMEEAFAALARGEKASLAVPHLEGRRANPAKAAAARIPVEVYAGPMLVAGGDRDATWASGEMVRAIAERRAEAGRSTVALSFADAGHGLAGTGWAPLAYPGMEAEAGRQAHAQAKVWLATLAFLNAHLPTTSIP